MDIEDLHKVVVQGFASVNDQVGCCAPPHRFAMRLSGIA